MSNTIRTGILITGDASGAIRQIKLTDDELARLNKTKAATKTRAQDLMAAWGDLSKRAVMIGGVVTGLATGAFALMVKHTIDAQDALQEMSERTNIGVRDLAGLQHAAKMTGTELGVIEKGLKNVSVQVLDASRGLKASQENFDALGISVHDSNGELKTSLQIMIESADKISSLKNETEQLALATKVYGKAGAELLPFLKSGGDGIARMVREGQLLNPVTEESAKRAAEFNDNLDRLKGSTAGWATTLAGSLLPALVDTSDWMLKIIDHQVWLERHMGETTSEVEAQVNALANMSISQVARQIQASYEETVRLQKEIAERERLGNWGGWTQRMRDNQELANAELEAANRLLAESRKRLSELQVAASAAAVDLDVITNRMGGAAGAAVDLGAVLNRMDMQFGSAGKAGSEFTRKTEAMLRPINLNRQALDLLNDEMARSATVAIPGVLTEVDDLRAILNDTGYAYGQLQDRSSEASDAMVRDWQNVRQSFGEFFADLVMQGGNAFDALLQSWKRTALQLTGSKLFDMGASLLGVKVPGGSGESAGGAFGTVLSAVGSKFLPGLFGAGAAVAPAGMPAMTAAAINLPTTAGAGTGLLGGISSAISAIPGWGWAAMAAAVAAKVLVKESTPSWNAGFLTDPTTPLGKSGRSFATDAFASGFQPVGFYRRSTQQEAESVIDLFRGVDQAIVDLASSAGKVVSADSLRGLSETLLAGTSGTVFGSGGEEGKPGLAIEQQLQMFAAQLVESLRGQIEDRDLDSVLAAGGVDEMLAALEAVLSTATEAGNAVRDSASILQERMTLQAEYDQLTMTGTQLLEQQRDALDESNRALFDQIQALKEQERVEEERTATFEASLNAAQRMMADLRTEQERAIRDHYDTLMDKERELHNRRLGLFRSLMDLTSSLKLGNLTTLSPRDQLAFAQSQFRSLAATALNTSLSMDDRVTAAESLQQVAEQYLAAGQGVHASSSGYKTIFDEVMQTLDAAKFLGTNKEYDPANIQNQMLEELRRLNTQVGQLPPGMAAALAGTMSSLISQAILAGKSPTYVANTISSLGPAAVSAGGSTYQSTYGTTIEEQRTSPEEMQQVLANIVSTSSSEREAVERAVEAAKNAGLHSDYLGQFIRGSGGASVDEILARHGIQKFAKGGDHMGGWRVVGEDGPELEYTGPSRIYSNSDSQLMFASNDRALQRMITQFDKLNATVGRLVSIEIARGEQERELMTQQTDEVRKLGAKRVGAVVGSETYAKSA